MPSSKVTTTIRLEESDYKALQEIAEKEVRSVNNLMEYALKKYLEEYLLKKKEEDCCLILFFQHKPPQENNY